ncbi:MAG TPA: inorganic phosphate transporter [Pirellulales bacterium]|nr:inorganic phosphate transporter [Pirellulales bacterium]
MPNPIIETLGVFDWLLLVLALSVVFGFEFVNGFHDTANAVATVIYTHSLKPWLAVVWSGFCNFLGVYLGGIAVAFTIVHLLPVDLLVHINTHAGIGMVFALLAAATIWNFGTWYLALPASSSHALIGSILGVGLANSILAGKGFGVGVNWTMAGEVGLSLLFSPAVGFGLAAVLLLVAKRLIPSQQLYRPPEGDEPPPGWIRAILIVTCTGVSFAHGSNDGQKGVGMVMLILIGLVPAHYALNLRSDAARIAQTRQAAEELGTLLAAAPAAHANDAQRHLAEITRRLAGATSYAKFTPDERWQLRTALLGLGSSLKRRIAELGDALDPRERSRLRDLRAKLLEPIEYAPPWVLLAVACSLGVGTTVGWKRIVVTVGEKIGKAHLTYGQGACAELVAMGTIGLADRFGFPVSTTHVLSSAVAGTMAANRSGVQLDSVKKIALAWVLTLPATMVLSGAFLCLFRVFWR